MSNWIGDVSDSDVEDSDVVTSDSDDRSESSDDDENEGFQKWKKKDTGDAGGDDDTGARQIASNKDKAMQAVCDSVDKFDFVDFDDDTESWKQAVTYFEEVSKFTEIYMNKFNTLPEAFAHLMKSLTTEIEQHKDTEFKNTSARKMYQRFAKMVAQSTEQYKEQIEQAINGDDDDKNDETEEIAGADDDEEKALTREAMEAFLLAATTAKADIKMCRRIISTSRQQSLKTLEIAAMAHLCACLLENAPSTGPSSSLWREAYRALTQSMTLAFDLKVSVSETGNKFTDSLTNIKNGWSTHATALHTALIKAVQNAEYVPDAKRIKDESLCASVLDRTLDYYMEIKQKRGISRCASALLEILYVRNERAHGHLRSIAPAYSTLTMPARDGVAKLAALVEDNSTDSDAKILAKLANIYSMALHDRFYGARDAFLRANVQLDPIEHDDALLVRYNRTVAQLGLCAFRTGLFTEAHTILGELCAKNGRELRELLGQVDLLRLQRRFADEDVEKTARDRYRYVPPHHALPVQLIEHGHLVLSMANDVIVEAKNPEDRPQRSKQFFSLCKRHQNALFRGQPNDDNERIYAAYESLLEGAMTQAIEHVRKVSSWSLLPATCNALELLEAKLRADGLKVFLISRGQHYASLTVTELVTRFGLSADEVKAIVSRLLLDHTLIGHWDQEDTHVIIERGPQSRLHLLSRDCADRIAQFAAYNENPSQGPSGRGEGRGRGGAFGGGRGRGRGRGAH